MRKTATVALASSALCYAAYKIHTSYKKKALYAKLNMKKDFSLPHRKEVIKKLRSQYFDVLIIGGGSAGAGCALDATTRGLKTAMVERGDFGSETSSKSTKLLHGGIRYLEKAFKNFDINQFLMVKEGLRERSYVIENAPYLTKKLDIMLPVHSWMKIPYFLAGLKVYDLISGFKSLGPSHFLNKQNTLKAFPALKGDGLKGSVVYTDGQFDDARLNVMLCVTAAYHGATVANYTEVLELKSMDGRVCGATCKDMLTGEIFNVFAKGVINSTGPFMDSILRMPVVNNPKCLNKDSSSGDRSGMLVSNNEKNKFVSESLLLDNTRKTPIIPTNASIYWQLSDKFTSFRHMFKKEKVTSSESLIKTRIDTPPYIQGRKGDNNSLSAGSKKTNLWKLRFGNSYDEVEVKNSDKSKGMFSRLISVIRSRITTNKSSCSPQSDLVAPSSGVHIVLPQEYAPNNRGLVLPETEDGRVLFFIPWKGKAVIGTTDRPCIPKTNPNARSEDIDFLLDEVKHTLNIPATKKDILAAWCGIRPLVRDPTNNDSQNLVRNHLVFTKNGMTNLCGGKWTTYRQMAEDAVSAYIKDVNLPASSCVTRHLKVVGAHSLSIDTHLRVAARLGVSAHIAKELVDSYGDRAFLIGNYLQKYREMNLGTKSDTHQIPFQSKNSLGSQKAAHFSDCGTFDSKNRRVKYTRLLNVIGLKKPRSIMDSTSLDASNTEPNELEHERNAKYLLQAETEYSIDHEMACKISDVLARRSRIAFTDNYKAHDRVGVVAAVMANRFGWNASRTKKEIKDAHDYIDILGIPKNM